MAIINGVQVIKNNFLLAIGAPHSRFITNQSLKSFTDQATENILSRYHYGRWHRPKFGRSGSLKVCEPLQTMVQTFISFLVSYFGHNSNHCINKAIQLDIVQRALSRCHFFDFSWSWKKNRGLSYMLISKDRAQHFKWLDRILEQQKAIYAVLIDDHKNWHLDQEFSTLETVLWPHSLMPCLGKSTLDFCSSSTFKEYFKCDLSCGFTWWLQPQKSYKGKNFWQTTLNFWPTVLDKSIYNKSWNSNKNLKQKMFE